jgi:type IV secretory pathway VirB2 component (pilin)
MKLLQLFVKKEKAPLYILLLILLVFLLFTLYLARNLKMGVSPDSYYHLEVSQAYSETLGIPENTPDTYKWKDITRIPFLSLWINGRILNLNEMIFNFDEILLLRVFNVLTALGTLIFVYLTSRRVIKNKWGQILPVFLLSNTLMFLFLSSSINYDNLTILFSSIAIYFLIRFLQNPNHLKNSLLMWIFLLLGSLTKNTTLLLAFIMVIVWGVFLLRAKVLKREFSKQFFTLPNILFLVVILFLLGLNMNLYLVNILSYGGLGPSCTDMLTYEQCLESGVFARGIYEIPRVFEGNVLEVVKLLLRFERIWPILYLPYWIVEMFRRIYGIMGDRFLFMPYEYVSFYLLYFFIGIYLVFKNRKNLRVQEKALVVISVSYGLFLAYYVNYKAYITHDWMDLALQGRYIFPVLAPVYIVFSKYFIQMKNKKLLKILMGILIVGFLLGSIGYFFLYVPNDWFVGFV